MVCLRATLKPSYLLLASTLLVAACNDGALDGGTTPPTDYAGFQAQMTGLQTTWGGIAPTQPSSLPISGGASYSGVVQMTLETGSGAQQMAGTLSLAADFATATISGGASGFVDAANIAYGGALALSGGVLDPSANPATDYTYSANIGGTLSGGGEDFTIAGDLQGDFLGPEQLGAVGVISGSATSSFGTGYMFGDFLAEQ